MLFYSSRLSFSCGGVGKPPFSRAGRAGGLTCGATMARLGPRYGSGRFSLRATSSRVEGEWAGGDGAAPWCRSPCVLRAVFFVLVRNNPSLRIASASQRIPVGPARRFPRTPSEKRHTNAYGCHESPFEPSINSLIHRQEVKERSSVGWVRRRNRQTPPASLPRVFASERHRLRHDRPRRRHVPDPIRRKGRKTLAKVYDSLSGPEKAPDRSRIIGLPTKKEARDIRNELTAAAWVGADRCRAYGRPRNTSASSNHSSASCGPSKTRSREPRRRVFRPAGAAEGYPRDQP